MADTIKCPNCGSNLILNADTQKLECSSCGAAFIPDELDVTVEELEKKSETNEETTTDAGNEQPEHTEFVCNACGAKLITDSHTAATFCAFCGSPALVGKRLTEKFQPQYIIPFKYSRESAENAFIKWAGKGKWTPFGFVSKNNIKKLTGLYVPFWLFNIDATVHIGGKGTIIHSHYNYDEYDYYDFERLGKHRWTNIPLDGETRIDDELMEAIEPFYLNSLIPYDYKYLPGFYADKFDLTASDLSARATKRGMDGIKHEIQESVSGYSRHTIKWNKSKIDSMEANYALLPVWFLSYKYHDKFYYFAMNGQTGEVAGNLPYSPIKKVMIFSVLLAVFAVITRLILGIFMRGIWG